jgi:site-specific DNA-methyltransferase (adenine-specific)
MKTFNTNLGMAYNADCFEVMKMLPDNCIDMILADLPYGTTACKWDTVIPFDKLWKEFHRIAKTNAAIVLTASQPFTSALVMSNIKGFQCEWIWEKNIGSNFAAVKSQPMKEHESVLVFKTGKVLACYNPQMQERSDKGKSNIGRTNLRKGKSVHQESMGDGYNLKTPGELRYPRSIQQFFSHRHNGNFHPTQKPVELFEYLIKTYSNEGQSVFDPTAGSLTTGLAAENLNRHWICCEKETDYFEKGIARFNQL